MTPPDYDKHRLSFTWRTHEIERCVFHVDAALAKDGDITELIGAAPDRHKTIADTLGFDLRRIYQENIQYWFFGPELFPLLGIDPGKKPFSTGQVTDSGIDYVVANDCWSNHVQHIFHEETHQLVMREIGEAPALFNEGIAVYTESMVFHGKEAFHKLCAKTWKKQAARRKGVLRELMSNEFFWSKYGKWPVYTLGAAAVNYVIETYGLSLLMEVFRATDYDDTRFDRVVEAKLGISIDEMQANITKFYKESI